MQRRRVLRGRDDEDFRVERALELWRRAFALRRPVLFFHHAGISYSGIAVAVLVTLPAVFAASILAVPHRFAALRTVWSLRHCLLLLRYLIASWSPPSVSPNSPIP